MHYMVLLVVYDMNASAPVLDAWEAAQVPGITILESTGLGTIREIGMRDDLPLMPSLRDLFRSREHHHRTLFTVVEGEEMVDQLIARTEEIMGDLNDPHNGVLFVLPVARVVGFRGAQERARKE
jgi:hypothetical protein